MHEIHGADRCAFIDYNKSNDFYLFEVGTYVCNPGYSYGPLIRTESIFHYVLSGRGHLILDGKRFDISAHQGFLIPKDCMAYYEADKEDPWQYAWIHVDGPRAAEIYSEVGLTKTTPLFIPSFSADEAYDIIVDIYNHLDEECYCMGKVYEFFNVLVTRSCIQKPEESDLKLSYVKKIIRYIQVKYSESISIEDIAYICGLNRSYLTRLFKDATGYTPQQYLINYRIKKSKEILANTNASIQQVSFLVGYSDTFTFSKAFKKIVGMAPSEYREDRKKNKNYETDSGT